MLVTGNEGTSLCTGDDLAFSCRQIRIPGFSDRQVKPYRRPAARILHEKRTAAVRRATSAASEATAAKQEKEQVDFY